MSDSSASDNMSARESASDTFNSQPSESQGFLAAAHGVLEGALTLSQTTPLPALALTLLCGHACEAALKAILAKDGISVESLKKKPYGHNIKNLLQKAKKNRHLILPDSQNAWVLQLNTVYDTPYLLRYPLGFQGLVLPNQEAMINGTKSIVEMSASYIEKTHYPTHS